jgi:ATP-dependent Lhr-like helicase
VIDLLRNFREAPDAAEAVMLAATDPANPYGSIFRWPQVEEGRSLTRTTGASVILVNGALTAYLFRGERQMYLALPDDPISAAEAGHAVAATLARLVEEGARRAMLITEINGEPAVDSPHASHFVAAGFVSTSQGLQKRTPLRDRQRRHSEDADA